MNCLKPFNGFMDFGFGEMGLADAAIGNAGMVSVLVLLKLMVVGFMGLLGRKCLG